VAFEGSAASRLAGARVVDDVTDRTQGLTVRRAAANLSCIVQDPWSKRQIAETLYHQPHKRPRTTS